jgi:hypothetical protein
MARQTIRILLVKPSKYAIDGYVERFRKGFMPNATLLHLKSMTPQDLGGRPIVVDTIDEYTQTNLRYLDLLRPETCSLLAMVGVQSHQMHRALDLTALAQANGVRNCVIGGPHVMTCDQTSGAGWMRAGLHRGRVVQPRHSQSNPQVSEPTGALRRFVSLCHRHGISTHFSNILGFPEQDETAVLQDLRELRALRPFVASFYILTPVPGTDQYDEFLRTGLIDETNLDRFDGTCAVWRHPHLSAERLEDLLFRAYREFFAPEDILAKLLRHRWKAHWLVNASVGLGYAAFARFAASRRMHPMTGGFCRIKLDMADDYLPQRRRIFGIARLKLPASLSLSRTTNSLL